MQTTIKNWSGKAFNQVPHSDNRIHSNEIAKAYGFTGALVPGTTISAYLLHPAVEAWGMDWLQRGFANVKVLSPLYDNANFQVTVKTGGDKENPDSYSAELKSGDRLCAVAEVGLSLNIRAEKGPAKRGHPVLDEHYKAPEVTRDYMEVLWKKGCPAMQFLWSAEHEIAAYLRDQTSMAALLRTDQSGKGGYANPGFLLGCGNRHFASVAKITAWIHMETRSRNFQAVELGTRLLSEMRIIDLFNKKGHEFADCRFNLFHCGTGECVSTIEQRAIYKLRPSAT